jgi:hypothetical protein
LALKIFGQDARILKMQTREIQRRGKEQFSSTDLDLLGPHIMRLLRRAERKDLGPVDRDPYRKEVEMDV